MQACKGLLKAAQGSKHFGQRDMRRVVMRLEGGTALQSKRGRLEAPLAMQQRAEFLPAMGILRAKEHIAAGLECRGISTAAQATLLRSCRHCRWSEAWQQCGSGPHGCS